MKFVSLGAALAASLLLAPALPAQDTKPAPQSTPSDTTAKAKPKVKASPRRKGKLSKPKGKQTELNGASKAELMKLPGITPELADKIIAARPFLSKAQLNQVLPQGYYLALRDKIQVAPPPLPKGGRKP